MNVFVLYLSGFETATAVVGNSVIFFICLLDNITPFFRPKSSWWKIGWISTNQAPLYVKLKSQFCSYEDIDTGWNKNNGSVPMKQIDTKDWTIIFVPTCMHSSLSRHILKIYARIFCFSRSSRQMHSFIFKNSRAFMWCPRNLCMKCCVMCILC